MKTRVTVAHNNNRRCAHRINGVAVLTLPAAQPHREHQRDDQSMNRRPHVASVYKLRALQMQDAFSLCPLPVCPLRVSPVSARSASYSVVSNIGVGGASRRRILPPHSRQPWRWWSLVRTRLAARQRLIVNGCRWPLLPLNHGGARPVMMGLAGAGEGLGEGRDTD